MLSGIIFLKMFIATRIFKNKLIDVIDSFFYINIIFFASFTSYNLSTGQSHLQYITASISIYLTMLVTIFIIFYHIHQYTSLFSRCCKSKCMIKLIKKFTSVTKQRDIDEHQLASVFPDNSVYRFDDIFDISNSTNRETHYHKADSASVQNKPTSSVVGMN